MSNISNKEDNKVIFLKKYLFIYLLLFLIVIGQLNFSTKIENDKKATEESESFIDTNNFIEKLFNNLRDPFQKNEYVIKNNDSIQSILKKYNIKKDEIEKIIKKLKEQKLTNIYSGRKLTIVSKTMVNGDKSVINILYPVSNTLTIEVLNDNKKDFLIKKNIIQLTKREVVVRNTIKNNLYSSAIKSGVEPNIIVEFARIYGFEIDFQRDIREGDWFEIYYEKFLDKNNNVKDTGRIIYASMYVNNEEINLYNFKDKDGFGYYDLNGKSVVKTLMKTPINGARLSSSFGMRKHPILGFNKMHRGTDFAAPKGTPIMASGSGTVTRARWCGGGGNCVKIRHNSTYETIYAHMSKFGRGIKEGTKVRQGQIIGYVGSTGLSTGPHLHYEVIINGKKVNSQKLKLPSGKILNKDDRKNFEIERIKIDLKMSELKSYKGSKRSLF